MVSESTIVTALFSAAALLLGILLEYRFGFLRRVEILLHRLANSEAKARITAVYETDLPFDNVKDEVKSVLRETYGEIEAGTDGSKTLEVTVDDRFTVTVTRQDDGFQIRTGKIVSTMRGMKRDLADIHTVLADLHDRHARQTEQSGSTFAEESFDIDLEAPHGSKYVTFHLPLGTRVTERDFTFEHAAYDWSITDDTDGIHVHAGTLDHARRVTRKILGVFLTR
ncbi:MAG: hypothetical protein ABEK12_03590 [Candidatus Nanohaloarchaea archaeon]